MNKWEYQMTRIDLRPEHYTDVRATLNDFGEDQWEVVGLIPIVGEQNRIHVLLKRPKT
jgi:hypothetical protein